MCNKPKPPPPPLKRRLASDSFLQRMINLLEGQGLHSVQEWICWSSDGSIIYVPSEDALEANVCRGVFGFKDIKSWNKQMNNWGFRRFTKQQRLHHMRSIGADEHAQHNTKIWFHDSLKRGCSQDEIDAVRRHEDGKARKRRREAAWCAKSAVVQHEHSSGSDGAADAHDKVDILSFVATRRLETEGWSGTTRPQPVQAGPSRTTQTRTGTYGGWTAHPPLIGFSDPRAFVLGTSTPVPATNPPLPAIRPAPTTAAFELDASFAPRAATRSSSIPFTSSSLSLVRHTADEAYAFESSQSQGRWSPGIDSSGSLMSVSTPKAAGQPGSSGGEMTGEVWDHGLTRGASELFERVHW